MQWESCDFHSLRKWWWEGVQSILLISVISVGNDSEIRNGEEILGGYVLSGKRREEAVRRFCENCVLCGRLKKCFSDACSTGLSASKGALFGMPWYCNLLTWNSTVGCVDPAQRKSSSATLKLLFRKVSYRDELNMPWLRKFSALIRLQVRSNTGEAKKDGRLLWGMKEIWRSRERWWNRDNGTLRAFQNGMRQHRFHVSVASRAGGGEQAKSMSWMDLLCGSHEQMLGLQLFWRVLQRGTCSENCQKLYADVLENNWAGDEAAHWDVRGVCVLLDRGWPGYLFEWKGGKHGDPVTNREAYLSTESGRFSEYVSWASGEGNDCNLGKMEIKSEVVTPGKPSI